MTIFRAALLAKGALCFLVFMASTASAQDRGAAEFGVVLTGGTLGIGPELSAGLSRTIGIRANATFLTGSGDVSTGDLDYEGTVRLRSAGLMIDLFPTGGGFHISAGARTNGNRADLIATPNRSATIGNTGYMPAQIGTSSGQAHVADVAPQVTIGYRKRSGGLTLGLEAGALFQGRARIDQFTSSTGLVDATDLDHEREALPDAAGKYRVYPVVQFTFGWHF